MGGERTQREAEVFVDVQGSGGILFVIRAVLRLVFRPLQNAAVDQELTPLVVGVAVKQRVVEVEESEAHASAPSLTSEAALDPDAEFLRAQQALRLARLALGAHRPVGRKPVTAED